MLAHGPSLFSYCVLTRERLIEVRLERPLIGVVLSGAKEIWRSDATQRFEAGSMFVLPPQVALDIVNEPDPRRDLYQSLILEIEPDRTPDVATLAGSWRGAETGSYEISLTHGLVEAATRAACAIADGPAAETVRASRLTELLALLAATPAARPLFDLSTGERMARMVRGELDAEWTASLAAKRLALSESTLRRRLAREGASFSAILSRERMQAARAMLARGESSQAAAGAVGYASRAHFARRFRAAHGRNPRR